MTEIELIEKCRQRNAGAQKVLYELFARKMLGVCMRYTSDLETARDWLQEGFVTVFEMLHTFNGSGSFEGWVRRIMVNTALQHLRQKVVFQETTDIASYESSLVSEYSVLETLSANDLMNIINSLPPGFRTVFNLYAIEGYSHKEISEMLHISEGCSRSQYSRARKQLQKIVISQNGEAF